MDNDDARGNWLNYHKGKSWFQMGFQSEESSPGDEEVKSKYRLAAKGQSSTTGGFY